MIHFIYVHCIVCHLHLSLKAYTSLKAALTKKSEKRQDKHLLRNREKGLKEFVAGERVQGG